MARKEFPIIDLDQSGEVQLSLEERYRTLATIFKMQFFEMHKLLAERYGWEESNELAGTVTDPSVPLLVEGYRRKFDLPGEGAALLSQVLQAEFQAEGSDVLVIEETETSAEVEIRCIFGDGLQNGPYAGSPVADGLCNKGCLDFVNALGETMEPKVTAQRFEWMAEGAERCRYCLTREG